MNSSDYRHQLEEALGGEESYKSMETDHTEKIHNKLKKLVNEMYKNGEIDKELKKISHPS